MSKSLSSQLTLLSHIPGFTLITLTLSPFSLLVRIPLSIALRITTT